MKKVVFLKINDSGWLHQMYGDESGNDENWEMRGIFKPAGRFVTFLRRVLFSRKIYEKVPLQNTCVAKFLLRASIFNPANLKPNEVLVVCTNCFTSNDYVVFQSKYVQRYWEELTSERRAFAYLTDTIEYTKFFQASILNFTNNNAAVITWSKSEADRFGFKFLPHPAAEFHFDLYKSLMRDEPEFDFSMLCYSLEGDGRIEVARRLQEVGTKQSASFIFNLEGTELRVNFKDRADEPDSVLVEDFEQRCGSVNCVVQICRYDGNYAGYPTYEALTFGRKLLTNAQSIKELPFYNPEYIKVISSLDEITPELIDWMKARVPVKYENLDCISLDHFKKELQKIVS